MHWRASFLSDFCNKRVQRVQSRIGNVFRNVSDSMHMNASMALKFPEVSSGHFPLLEVSTRCILQRKCRPIMVTQCCLMACHVWSLTLDTRKQEKGQETVWSGRGGECEIHHPFPCHTEVMHERRNERTRRGGKKGCKKWRWSLNVAVEHSTTTLILEGRKKKMKKNRMLHGEDFKKKTGSCLVTPFSRSGRREERTWRRDRYEKTTRGIRMKFPK